MRDLEAQLFKKVQGSSQHKIKKSGKITIVGVGNVGLACATSILSDNLCEELVLIDVQKKKVMGEVMDLNHSQAVRGGAKVTGGWDYAISAGSDICIITAGVAQKPGESRLNLLARNVKVFSYIVPPLAKFSPSTTFIVVANPVDIMTYVTWKMSGFDIGRVIGSGTSLDTSRLRHMLGRELSINPKSVHAYVIGEHGDSSVSLWSMVNVAGRRLYDIIGDAEEFSKGDFAALHKQVQKAAYEIIVNKGYTNWGIGSAVSALCSSIVHDSKKIYTVSTLVCNKEGGENIYGVKYPVFLSVPGVLGANGLEKLVNIKLNTYEMEALNNSASTMYELQKQLKLQNSKL